MEIIKNTKGCQKLCYGGFRNTKNFTIQSHVPWECDQRRSLDCKGSVTTDVALGNVLSLE